MCLRVFLLPADWEKMAMMQQSCGRAKEKVKEEKKSKETGTRGSEGVRREVADSKRKISRRGS